MKKKICLILMMLLMLCSISLCGCAKADDKDNKKKSEAGDDEENGKKKKDKDKDDEDKYADTPELSDKIFIGYDYAVIPPTEAGYLGGYIYIYTDGRIVGLLEDEPIYEGTITEEQYNNIATIDRKKLYNLEIETSENTMDGSSYYLRLFGADGQILKDVGGYEPTTKYFNKCRSIIYENLPMDEIFNVFDAKAEEINNERFGTYEGGLGDPEIEPFYYAVDNWEGDYYSDGTGENTYNNIGITLEKTLEEPNEIIDTEDWLLENGFVSDEVNDEAGYYIESNGYYLRRYDPDDPTGYYPYCLDIFDEYFNFYGTIDFSEYIVPKSVVESDRAYCTVWLRYAWIDPERNVVYASLAHSTYSNSGPETGYIIAVDLTDGHIVWRTESLTCNSDNFCVIEDTIVCGYGFTAEDDYIYQIDVNTGIRYKKIKTKSSPDKFYFKDGSIYVRCYDTNYVFEVSYG